MKQVKMSNTSWLLEAEVIKTFNSVIMLQKQADVAKKFSHMQKSYSYLYG